MSKQLLKGKGGAVVEILADLGGHYAVKYTNGGDTPFVIVKDSYLWEPYDLSNETPQPGDIVAGPYGHSDRFRVLGVTDDMMVCVLASRYADGEWPTAQGTTQRNIDLEHSEDGIMLRSLPDPYLKVRERP